MNLHRDLTVYGQAGAHAFVGEKSIRGGGQEGVVRGSKGGQEGNASQQGRDRLRPVQHLPSVQGRGWRPF
eukprot:1186209-Prorocentrum_minimum.AAC.3